LDIERLHHWHKNKRSRYERNGPLREFMVPLKAFARTIPGLSGYFGASKKLFDSIVKLAHFSPLRANTWS
jgi:hypothetical protein